MNLGDLARALEAFPDDARVRFDFGVDAGHLDSWRGVYAEATVTWAPDGHYDPAKRTTVGDLRKQIRGALGGEVFQGYKGGDFTFDKSTTVWADDYGRCTYNAITGVRNSYGDCVLVTTNVEEYR